jgi:hypothetical protein
MLIVILGDRRNRRGRLMKLLMPGPYLRRQGRRSTNKARIQAREALAQRIVEKCSVMLVALADLEDDIRSLWDEFERLPKGETILGCTTKKEFCEKLGRTPRAVRYMLDGGNQNNGGEIISPAKAGTLAEAIAEIVVPPEVAEAVEYIPPPARAKSEAKNENSETVLLRQLFEKMKSVKLVRLVPSTFKSGVPSASGRYDLALNGLTPAQVKKIRELL